MIAGLSGTVVSSHGDGVVHLQCGPVTLELFMPLCQAAGLNRGDEAELSTYLHLATTSDTLKLYAFTSGLARDLFATLLGGPGVGPKVALALLELGEAGLIAAVRDGDEKGLTSVKGVGPKLAKKIILELSEKVAKEFATISAPAVSGEAASPVAADALDAVVALGYPRPQAEQALGVVRKAAPDADTAMLIRKMLAMLAG